MLTKHQILLNKIIHLEHQQLSNFQQLSNDGGPGSLVTHPGRAGRGTGGGQGGVRGIRAAGGSVGPWNFRWFRLMLN